MFVKSCNLLMCSVWQDWPSHHNIWRISPNPNVPSHVSVSSGLRTRQAAQLDNFNLRHGVVEGGEGARHHRDVHDVPEITHISSWVQDEALIENLQK